jgi:outer membrane receptor protein involved in Fe transport
MFGASFECLHSCPVARSRPAREVQSPDRKPLTVRFTVVNVLDTVYEIRDGTGIGVFAPQYGPRRGFFVSLSQAL